MSTILFSQDLVIKNGAPTSSLIELYSSEGCSSCPPAEEWLNRYKTSSDLWTTIFPIAFHVDYWDGLGWPDRFARAEYTQRQRDYAARLGQDSVYTPEFVVNGQEWRRTWLVSGLPSGGGEKTGSLSMTVHAKEKSISTSYSSGSNGQGQSLMLNVAFLGFNVVTDVKRGENGGRKLEHDFVVLDFKQVPLTSIGNGNFTAEPVAIQSNTDDQPGAVVAWVSRADGSIAQIAGGWLSSADHPTR